jgi:deoxyribodipyrimidine photo-lyase
MNETLFPDLDQSSLLKTDWVATREAGLARLAAFTPSAGLAYASTRNTDFGPKDRSNVSTLSPWLSRRLITEQEVVAAVLKAHGFVKAEKFIQEVFWRTYWKGWLELRPDVLVSFNEQRLALKQMLKTDLDLDERVERAMSAQSGIECFDFWVSELRTFGWLHNHARMWFASIWIFTLNLPWQLGADFFYKHLIDADVASNTLSWRWVAGLQTKGKHYLARSQNIKAHTNGRFDPAGQLNETALPLTDFDSLPWPASLSPTQNIMSDRVGLLITQDDLHPESLNLQVQVVGAACLRMGSISEPGSPQTLFSEGALVDTGMRVEGAMGVSVVQVQSDLEIVAWAQSLGVTEIVTAYVPTGLVAWRLKTICKALRDVGIDLVQVRRDWDSLTWPLATGGFFKLKEKLPQLIGKLVQT